MKNKTAFDALVQDVKEQKLQPEDNQNDVEKLIDEYIKTHELAYVLDQGKYYIRYEHTGEWMPLTWYKLRRDCPIVFNNARTYLIHQQTVMARLKKAHRVFKTVRYVSVRFE